MIKVSKKEVLDALTKKALGYTSEEVTEEYQEGDGEITLTKRKVIKKEVPPDLSALKILLEEIAEKPITEMSDEQLQAEKERLLTLLKKTSYDKI